jgi:hypothetical protein
VSTADESVPTNSRTEVGELTTVAAVSNGTDRRHTEEDTTGLIADARTEMPDEHTPGVGDSRAAERAGPDDGGEGAGLAARVRLLEFENARLRNERDRAAERRHQRGALSFLGLGVLAAVGGYLLPESQTLLFSLAAIGLFSSVLAYYLTGGNLISVSTIERVYLAHAETLAEMVGELGLQDVGVYVPVAGGGEREGLSNVRLFVPQRADFEPPDELESVFVVTDDGRRRGVAVHPVGSPLFATFSESLRDPLAEAPDRLASQLSAALIEEFELVSKATPEYEPENERVTIRVRDSALGPVDRFDHPVASFLGTGLAYGLGRPIRTEVYHRDDETALVVCSWDETEMAGDDEKLTAP